jgi:hypothetical protein
MRSSQHTSSTFTIYLVLLHHTATLPYRERGQAVRGPESATPSDSLPSHNMIYAPECLEDEFCELRQNRILRSSAWPLPSCCRWGAWPRSGTIHVERAPAGSGSPSSPRRGFSCV